VLGLEIASTSQRLVAWPREERRRRGEPGRFEDLVRVVGALLFVVLFGWAMPWLAWVGS